jgi:hypothetical protein
MRLTVPHTLAGSGFQSSKAMSGAVAQRLHEPVVDLNRAVAAARTERPMSANRQILDAGWQEDRPMVQVEQRWRVHRNANEAPAKALSDVAVTSWAAPSHPSSFEHSVKGSDASATLTYLRSQATGEFWVAGRRVLDGRMAPQTLVIENSAEPKRSVCRGPTSMFRVYLSAKRAGGVLRRCERTSPRHGDRIFRFRSSDGHRR